MREMHTPTLVSGPDVSDIHKIVAKLTPEIAGARKHVVPGAGHLVPTEKPEEFNRLGAELPRALQAINILCI
jgi:pimeloyl-ACP methyl ester carboxylesterase